MSEEENPFLAKSLGSADTGSGSKAKAASERATKHMDLAEPDGWPRGVNGQPMMKIVMSASELIPTGQYANVSVGPAQITAFVDADRNLSQDADGNTSPYFSVEERTTMAMALNELAEIVEADVIATQRSLVLESLQEQIKQ